MDGESRASIGRMPERHVSDRGRSGYAGTNWGQLTLTSEVVPFTSRAIRPIVTNQPQPNAVGCIWLVMYCRRGPNLCRLKYSGFDFLEASFAKPPVFLTIAPPRWVG